MRDDQLLQDLEPLPYAQDTLSALKDHGITTYNQLFTFIKDPNADPDLRASACWVLFYLNKIVDKRRAVAPLLIALQSSDEPVRGYAAFALGMLHSRRAVMPLINLLCDTSQPVSVRHWAIDALEAIQDERAIPLFQQIINDPKENTHLRGRAIEMLYEEPDPVQKLIELLRDPAPDIRFWAAYRLASASPSSALPELDRIVAFDHTLPIGWGWHVDREALLPLEAIYFRKIMGVADEDEDAYPWHGMGPTYLISPAPEYSTLTHGYRQGAMDSPYELIKPVPEVTLRVNPADLAPQLQANWPQIRLNVRQPRPQAYLLDWHINIGDKHLIGGLHRDHYAVVLTGSEELAYQFADWYRSIIATDQSLFFYEWADEGIELTPGITNSQLANQIERRDTKRRQPPS